MKAHFAHRRFRNLEFSVLMLKELEAPVIRNTHRRRPYGKFGGVAWILAACARLKYCFVDVFVRRRKIHMVLAIC